MGHGRRADDDALPSSALLYRSRLSLRRAGPFPGRGGRHGHLVSIGVSRHEPGSSPDRWRLFRGDGPRWRSRYRTIGESGTVPRGETQHLASTDGGADRSLTRACAGIGCTERITPGAAAAGEAPRACWPVPRVSRIRRTERALI